MAPFVRLVELSDLFFPELLSIKKCLHGRSAAAHFSLISFDAEMTACKQKKELLLKM